MAAGPLLATTPVEAAKQQARLQEVESMMEPLPFDGAAVRSYGLDVYTRNGDDFSGLDDLVRVFAI